MLSNETVHMNTLYYIIITNLKFVSTPTNSSNFFYKLITYKLLMMNETDQSTTVEDTIIPEDNTSKTRARQSKRRKRSKVRKVEEHGQALDIPDLSLDLIIHKSNNLKFEHLSSLVDQFGYVPYNLIEIGAFSDDHEPQVAMVYPMNKSLSSGRYAKRWLPFPTMLWLSCPTLHTEICELEVDGWVQKLNDRLNSSDESAEYLEAMSKAHRLYATERWSLLTDEDRAVVEENGWTQSLRESGIAGMRDFNGVKCLHCHYAHHLARPQHDNIIGTWIHELLLLKRMDSATS